MSNHTPGPWHACHNGECPCGGIWCNDYPVAEVTIGKWGDQYPTIKLEGPPMALKAVAVMDGMPYGEVNQEEAHANARLIAAAPDLLEACKKACHQLITNANKFSKETWGIVSEQIAILNKAAVKAEKGTRRARRRGY